jgi:hypothetical protein
MVDGPDRFAAALWAVAVAVLAAFVEMAGHPAVLGPWSPVPPVLAGLVLAVVSTIVPRRRKAAGAGWVRAGAWLFAGGWVAYGYRWGLTGRYWQVRGWRAETWHVVYWQVGGFAALAAVALAAVFAVPTDLGPLDATGQPQSGTGEPAPDTMTEEWQQIIAAGSKGDVVGAHSIVVEPWASGHGYTVRGKLAGGDTYETLAKHTPGIASVLDLDEGAGVSVEPDGPAAGFALKVLVDDAMAEAVPYPGTEE